MDFEAWKFEQNWYAMKDWMWGQAALSGCSFDDPALNKAAHKKFGIEQPKLEPSKIIMVTAYK
jgi:hypothetical protein